MSGHSKWSKVKHQKATTDVVKGAAFTKASRAITIAVREGGGIGDPNLNFHLRLAIEKARDVNMPKDNIARAIEKGKGEGGASFEQVLYEAYGPGGAALFIEAATDNRQRTVSQVKNILDRFGGNLTGPGSVAYQFARSGVVTIPKADRSYDDLLALALEAGAQDVMETADVYEVYVTPASLSATKATLEAKGVSIDNTELIMKPTIIAALGDEHAVSLDRLVGELEALDDVQKVFTNAA